MDIPLDDPEANRAAAKIQAGFRGHMTRKKMKPEDKAEGEEVSSAQRPPGGSGSAAPSRDLRLGPVTPLRYGALRGSELGSRGRRSLEDLRTKYFDNIF